MHQNSSSSSLADDRLTEHAKSIWRAGVAAVDSSHLVQSAIRITTSELQICGKAFPLESLERIVVVGAGKAGGGMARGLEQALAVLTPRVLAAGDSSKIATKTIGAMKTITGWINVPADCVMPLPHIHLHDARPAGLNEPTERGVAGSRQILRLVESLGKNDLCIVLLSGGGSALLPLPVENVSLADKQAVTRILSGNGASINELNTVRKRLSQIKGGGLSRAASAGRMIALIISDVIGDPLDVIASGPTVDDSATAEDALAILHGVQSRNGGAAIPESIWLELNRQSSNRLPVPAPSVTCDNFIIGNNQTAVTAAIDHARQLGYQVRSLGSNRQGLARDAGTELAELALAARRESPGQPVCFIGGGEPVVHLATTTRPRKGGRNQELALAALCRLWNDPVDGIVILSGGTDGEDGPTDAAGAICSSSIRERARNNCLDPFDALEFNDSYTFFEAARGLLKTGPTHTNVMDLQVALIAPSLRS